MSPGKERGGVLLRVTRGDGELALGFIPAEVAIRLAALSSLTPVPGAPSPVAGIALADGAVVTVLELGESIAGAGGAKPSYDSGEDWIVPGADRAVLCHLGGFDVALTGATVLATGVFEVAPECDDVLWQGEVVPVIDVRALYAQADAAMWAEHAVTSGARATPRPPSAELSPPSGEMETRG